MIIEIALWLTVGLLLATVGYTYEDWQFWSLAATYWAVALLSRMRGRVEGIVDYLDLPEQEQQKIRRALVQSRRDASNG